MGPLLAILGGVFVWDQRQWIGGALARVALQEACPSCPECPGCVCGPCPGAKLEDGPAPTCPPVSCPRVTCVDRAALDAAISRCEPYGWWGLELVGLGWLLGLASCFGLRFWCHRCLRGLWWRPVAAALEAESDSETDAPRRASSSSRGKGKGPPSPNRAETLALLNTSAPTAPVYVSRRR